jgi:2-iminobutanoate/2-iminopropanoate deaminase
MKDIYTKKAPEPIGPYTQAKESGGYLYCSGQIAIAPETGAFEGGGIEAQTKRVCENIAEVLSAAGLDFSRVVKTTCFLKNSGDFAAFNETYAQYFTSRPARSCVYVAGLPKDALVEVEVVAEIL